MVQSYLYVVTGAGGVYCGARREALWAPGAHKPAA